MLTSLSLSALTACGDDTDSSDSPHTHTAGAAVKEAEIQATCKDEGSYDEVVYCSSCEEELSRVHKVTEKTNNHNFVDGVCSVCECQKPSEGFVFTSNGDGTCSLSGIGTCSDSKIVIPAVSPEGDRVTGIGMSAFASMQQITSVVIPEGVTVIGDYAFNSCNNLVKVTLPSTLEYLGDYSFDYCYSLELTKWDSGYYMGNEENPYLVLVKATVTYITDCAIHESTKFIGAKAFQSCGILTSVTIPEGVVSIGGGAFYYCSSLPRIQIPSTVTRIGDYAFYDCTKLSDVYITNLEAWCNITFVNSYSSPFMFATNFYINYKQLRELVIPDGIKEIKDYAFYRLPRLTSVTIPDSVETIGKSAFSLCDSLVNIIIPNSVKEINNSAFAHCTSLEEVTIGSGVSKIGSSAFSYCDSLQNAIFAAPEGWSYSSVPAGVGAVPIPTDELSSPSAASTALKSTYANYYWYKD